MVLLPTETNKLLMQWKGPFVITKKARENDHLLSVNRKENIFHANMLKKYVERIPITVGSVCCLGNQQLEVVKSGIKFDDKHLKNYISFCPLEAKETYKDVLIHEDHSSHQQTQMQELVEEYNDVFTDLPGGTDLVECSINLVDDTPFRVNPYPVPYALKKEMNA